MSCLMIASWACLDSGSFPTLQSWAMVQHINFSMNLCPLRPRALLPRFHEIVPTAGATNLTILPDAQSTVSLRYLPMLVYFTLRHVVSLAFIHLLLFLSILWKSRLDNMKWHFLWSLTEAFNYCLLQSHRQLAQQQCWGLHQHPRCVDAPFRGIRS
jgi:hypothetical protein